MTTTIAPKPAARFHPLLWAGAFAMLLVPAAAMLVTAEVNWGPEDFFVFSLMLGVLCLAIEAAWYWLDTPLKRFGGVMFAVLAFLAVWAELAVGILD